MTQEHHQQIRQLVTQKELSEISGLGVIAVDSYLDGTSTLEEISRWAQETFDSHIFKPYNPQHITISASIRRLTSLEMPSDELPGYVSTIRDYLTGEKQMRLRHLGLHGH